MTFTKLAEDEERRRMAIYRLKLTDRESAKRLGITERAYCMWRITRGLSAWRMQGQHFPKGWIVPI